MDTLSNYLKFTLLFGFLATLPLSNLEAHEFWLAPSNHTPQVGEQVEVYAMIGHGDDSEAFPRNNHHIKYLHVIDEVGTRKTAGANHRLPTAQFEVRKEGAVFVAYESQVQLSELPANRFNRYLKEEGMAHLISAHDKEPKSTSLIREEYIRCAKSILWTGAGTFKDQWLGLPLEIKCANNPFQRTTGCPLVLQVRFEGKPLAGLLIKGIQTESDTNLPPVRTDAHGMVKFPCNEKGRWMFSAIHMLPNTGDDSTSWQSYWASLTLVVDVSSVD